jgi:hypothetical protein
LWGFVPDAAGVEWRALAVAIRASGRPGKRTDHQTCIMIVLLTVAVVRCLATESENQST